MRVRDLLGDTQSDYPLLQDEQIMAYLSRRPNVYLAAAEGAQSIAGQFARLVDTTSGPSTTAALSQRVAQYNNLSCRLKRIAVRYGVPGYSGGTSIIDIEKYQQNDDIPTPFFTRGEDSEPGTRDFGGLSADDDGDRGDDQDDGQDDT